MRRQLSMGVALVLLLSGQLATPVLAATQTRPETPKTVISPEDHRQTGQVHITKANFLDYFNVNGSARYEPTTGIVTLTPDQRAQSGNVTLKNKIDYQQDFVLTGQLNIGDKSQQQGGADGIGIGFHSGKTTDVGQDGGAMGIGGLPGGFGWKADTYWNNKTDQADSWYDADPVEFAGKSKAVGDGRAFGALMANDTNGYVHTYDQADARAQRIDEPQGNEFKDVRVEYDGHRHLLVVYYDGQRWAKAISDLTHERQALAFMISASTGTQKNCQQFRLTQFNYSAYGVANTRFIDQGTGRSIATGKQYTGALGQTVSLANDVTQTKNALKHQGYTFKTVTATDAGHFDAQTDQVTMGKTANTITYEFVRQRGKVTIHYVDDATGQAVHQDTEETGDITAAYHTDPLKIDGYQLDQQRLPENATGTFQEDVQVVTYYYRRAVITLRLNGDVTTHYLDEVTGGELRPAQTQIGSVGGPYATHAPTIAGYVMDQKRQPVNAQGVFQEDHQDVFYYYRQLATLKPGQPQQPTTDGQDEKTCYRRRHPFESRLSVASLRVKTTGQAPVTDQNRVPSQTVPGGSQPESTTQAMGPSAPSVTKTAIRQAKQRLPQTNEVVAGTWLVTIIGFLSLVSLSWWLKRQKW